MTYDYASLKPLKEKGEDQYQPQEEQIYEYAKYIGVKLPGEEYLLELAKQGVKAFVPKDWEACQAPDGQLVYRNKLTKVVQEQHPLDNSYRQKVIELRQAYKLYPDERSLSMNTIIQQKSEQQSLSDSQLTLKNMSPNKQLANITQTLKQQIILQPQPVINLSHSKKIFNNGKMFNQEFFMENHNYQNSYEGNKDKILGKNGLCNNNKNNKQIQRLKFQLANLKKQEKLSEQLFQQLKKDNEKKVQKLKMIIKDKTDTSPYKNFIYHFKL